jgi:hypothetical protein
MSLCRIIKKHKNDIYGHGFALFIIKLFNNFILAADAT